MQLDGALRDQLAHIAKQDFNGATLGEVVGHLLAEHRIRGVGGGSQVAVELATRSGRVCVTLRGRGQLVDRILNRALFTSITTWVSTTRRRRSNATFAVGPM